MSRARACSILLAVLSAALLLHPGGSAAAEVRDAMHVFVSIPPQAFFVERVGGDRVHAHVMVEAGQSPHAFEPTPRQLADLSDARLYFAIGLPFERRLLEKARGINERLRVVHMEGDAGVRTGAMHDPHIWLSPRLVKSQARIIADALESIDPANAKAYEANMAAFAAELDEVDARISRMLAPHRGRRFYVYHPAFGHFADAYGLVQVAVEREGKEPGASELAALINNARKAGAKTIFVEPQFPKGQAEAIARAIGGRVVVLDPLAEDYADNLITMAEKIRDAISTDR